MKKILSFILALVILTSFSVLFVNAEESTDYVLIPTVDEIVGSVTYGFKNTEYWKDVYVYATGGRSEQEGNPMTFPGEKLEREYIDGYGYLYTFTFASGYYENLLFNDGTKNDYRAELKVDFYDYCVEKLGKPYYEADVLIDKTMKYHDGTVVFTATSWEEPLDSPVNVIINNKCYHRSATFSPYELGVYVSTNDEIYTLEEALDMKGFFGVSIDHGFSGFEYHSVYKEGIDLDLMHKCLYAFGDRYGYEPQNGEIIYCEPYGYAGENVIFHAYYGNTAYPQIIAKEQIGDYYFYNGCPCGIGENNSVALYVLTPDNKVYTLYEAFTQGVVKDLEAVVKLTGGQSIFGDFGKRVLELLNIDITADSWQHLYREIIPYYEGYKWHEKPDDGTLPDFVTVFAAESIKEEAPSVKRIGNYAVYNDHTYAPYELGYYVYFPKEDKVLNFEDAFEAYPQYRELMLSFLDYPQTGYYQLIGNVDYDNRITVRDATRIQKRIAGYDLGHVYREKLELEASDFNGDGKVNIKDVTAIQKYVARLDY